MFEALDVWYIYIYQYNLSGYLSWHMIELCNWSQLPFSAAVFVPVRHEVAIEAVQNAKVETSWRQRLQQAGRRPRYSKFHCDNTTTLRKGLVGFNKVVGFDIFFRNSKNYQKTWGKNRQDLIQSLARSDGVATLQIYFVRMTCSFFQDLKMPTTTSCTRDQTF